MSSIFNVYVILRFCCAQLVCIRHVVFFDTFCVLFSFVFFKFIVFEVEIYAKKDVFIKTSSCASCTELRMFVVEAG